MLFTIRLPLVAVAVLMSARIAAAAPQAGSTLASPIPVKGTERVGWDQDVQRAGWIVGLQFVAYVDDQPVAVNDAKCTPLFCTRCDCSAPLPQMSNGIHRIEVTARDLFGGVSPRSSPLYVALGSTARTTSGSTTRLGASSSVEMLSEALDRPSSIAVAPDGRVFIAEESGAVRLWRDGRIESRAAATVETARRPGIGLVGLALDPGFSNNARVFVAYSGRNADGTFANRIVRYREVGGVLGEAAVIFDDRVPEPAFRTPRIRFGPDSKLYVLFPAGPVSDIVDSSFAGKILRLNDDGTTPSDNRGSSPVFMTSHGDLTAFDWQPASRLMWTSEFSGRADVTSMAFRAPNDAAGGQLFIAARNRSEIDRIGFDAARRPRPAAMERWFDSVDAWISDLTVGPDGAVYFCVVRRSGRASDVLARLR